MRFVILFIVFLVSFNINASIIIFPENIIVESVNGIEQERHFFARETQLDLPTGNHVIVVKYQDLFEGDDDHTKVKSKPFVLLFTLPESFSNSEKITAVLPKLDDLREAKTFAKNPKLTLLAESGEEISSINQSLIAFKAQGTFEQLANNTKSAALEHTIVANKPSSYNASIKHKVELSCNDKAQESINSSKLERLKCLWQNASKGDQEAFIYYVLAKQQSAIQALEKNK